MNAAVGAVCEALGLPCSEAQQVALQRYIELLQRWNSTYNLTAVRDAPAMLTQHLADCLAVIPSLQHKCATGRLLDVGSGGGLPGVVIAVMMPGLQVSCVDTVGKKVAFIRQVAGALGQANLHAEHARVEALKSPPFDVITSRAFASLADFTSLTQGLLAKQGVWMAMKGQVPHDEIAALPTTLQVFHVEQLQVPGLDAQRCLVWIRPAADNAKN